MKRARTTSGVIIGGVIGAAALLGGWRAASSPIAVVLPAPAADAALSAGPGTETAVFAGGCFWGIQAVFQHIKGVVSATSGYAGGTAAHPSYEEVSTGTTGYAESVRVVFDPSKISYGELLHVFFSVAHDPTELNRQGPDEGTQYRSSLFYMTDAQKQTAQAYIAQLDKAKVFSSPIVTQVVKFTSFWPAEAYHQNYAELHPENPYIEVNDAPKVANLHKHFPQLYTDKLAAHE
jgi:peptide-methionine (S)-S-oxide reductase